MRASPKDDEKKMSTDYTDYTSFIREPHILVDKNSLSVYIIAVIKQPKNEGVLNMLAVEFVTDAENGIIKIPEKYRKIAEGNLKIIILKEEEKPEIPGKQKIANIKKLLKQIREKGIFKDMKDPLEWQKATRNEWT
jgi:hypothetical protein